MSRYRLIVTGKLLHLIKMFSERLECLKDLKKGHIEEAYELKAVEMETMRLFNHKNGDIDEARTGTIQLKFKLIITNSTVLLANMGICQWQDPGNEAIDPYWMEMKITMAKLKDSSTKLPERLSGETTLELTTAYLQLCPDKETRWYKHIVRLPKWAVEQEQMKEAKWIEEKIFQAVTSNVVRKSKEIRLEEKNGEGDITKSNVLPSTGTDPSTPTFIKYGWLNAKNEVETANFDLGYLQEKKKDPIKPDIHSYRKKVVFSEDEDGRYQHLYTTTESERETESEEDQMMKDFVQNKERVTELSRNQRENENIQHNNGKSEHFGMKSLNISNQKKMRIGALFQPEEYESEGEQINMQDFIQNKERITSLTDYQPPIPKNISMQEQLKESNLPNREVLMTHPQQQVQMTHPQQQVQITHPQQQVQMTHPQQQVQMTHPQQQQNRDTSFVQYMERQQEQRGQQPFQTPIIPAGVRNEEERQMPRETGNYVRLAMNIKQRPPIQENVWNNRNLEAQRAHTQYVWWYNQQLRNLPQRRIIQRGIPRAPGPPIQTSDDLIMLSTPRPQMMTPMNPILRPRGPMFQQRIAIFPHGGPRFPTPVVRPEPFMTPMLQQRDSFFPPERNRFTTPVARKQPSIQEHQRAYPPGRKIFTTPVPRSEPFIRMPQGTDPPDLLGRQTPGVLGVPDPKLLPQNTNNQSLDNEFQDVRGRLERPSNDAREPFVGFRELRRRLERESLFNDDTGKEVDKHYYEEIKENEDNVDQSTPKSWPTPAFQIRNASAPPSVRVLHSPDNQIQTPDSDNLARPIITIQEEAPSQEGNWQDKDWQDEDELGAVGGLGMNEQIQHKEPNAKSWENEHNVDGLEWDNTTFNWEWKPIRHSAKEEQDELQKLIEDGVQEVHQLERKITQSSALEQIWDNENIKCSLLYDENIQRATVDPNVLHDDQRERIKIMREIYEEVKLKKNKTMKALENVTGIGTIRKSKRLSSKPRRKYKK